MGVGIDKNCNNLSCRLYIVLMACIAATLLAHTITKSIANTLNKISAHDKNQWLAAPKHTAPVLK